MNFTTRICKSPIPYEAQAGADAAAPFAGAGAGVHDLIAGTAGCSGYLRQLISAEEGWLQDALSRPPEDVADDELTLIATLDGDQVGPGLRRAKRRLALLAALCDLGGVWDLTQVTGCLTRLADAACDRAFRHELQTQFARGKLPGLSADDLARGAGFTVLAMGKMGAFELNYSSDIDLIVLFDETRHDGRDFDDIRAGFVRATRNAHKLLSAVTAEGYVFRTDLRLRPDPSVTPVCMSMAAAERYFESFGRTWERAAYIKARACAVDVAAGEDFLTRLTPFVWRRHLDFAAIQDAHDMRLKIREHKGTGGPISIPGHNMKLGRGGIREIEFFTQTRQLISGGRDPDLRQRGTCDGLAALAAKGWVGDETAHALTQSYGEHRRIEHRLQMIADAQTHSLPTSREGFDRLAAFCGAENSAALRVDIRARLEMVHELTESFFAPGAGSPKEEPPEVAVSENAQDLIDAWPRLPALRSARARQIFERLCPELMRRLARATDPDDAILQFNGFLAGLPAGVQILSMFEANPTLVDLLIEICTTSPALARHLSQHAAVLEAVIGGSFFAQLPTQALLGEDLDNRLRDADDYELVLRRMREWKAEQHFRIGVHHLRGLIDAATASAQYSTLADVVLGALWPNVVDEFARRYGAPPGRGAMVLGMGSLGARGLGSSSDLDLIVIYDALGQEASDGPRPLAVSTYFSRLTQALIRALSAPMQGGVLYEADMRLRPSGRQGPVATSITGFEHYQTNKAWTWEHMALTRARGICGDPALMRDVDGVRARLLGKMRTMDEVTEALSDMRARIDAAGASKGAGWRTGPGSVQDISLLAQAGALLERGGERNVPDQIAAACRAGLIRAGDADCLTASFQTQTTYLMALRLIADGATDPGTLGKDAQAFLCRQSGAGDLSELLSSLETARQQAASIIDRATRAGDS